MFLTSGTAVLLTLGQCASIVIRWLCLIGLVLGFAVGVYRVTLHPLAGVRGPRLAALSNVWYARHIAGGRMARIGLDLHSKYGDIVRVGPNEVWFNSKEAFDQIYCTGKGFDKSDFYLATALTRPVIDWRLQAHFPDTLDLLSEQNVKRYRLQRRAIGRVYSAANVLRYEAAIENTLKLAVKRLSALEAEEVDLREWMHIIAVECLGACVLSWSPGMLRDGHDGGTLIHSFRSWRRKSLFGVFPTVKKLEQWSPDLGRLFASFWGVTYKTPASFRPFFPAVGRIVSNRIKASWGPRPRQERRGDLLDDLMALHKEKPEFSETYLRKMAMTNFGAGHETMASTLTSALAMIGSHEAVQNRVSKEVRCSRISPSDNASTRYPYTKAAIRESMRLFPVVSMSPPRKTPPAGMHVHGLNVPADTTVGCNPAALHRREDIFGPNADKYDPLRWLPDDLSAENKISAVRMMERYNLSWGGGSRSCPGRNLAELIVLRTIIALFAAFKVDVYIPPDADSEAYFLFVMSGVKARFLPSRAMDQD